MKLLEIKLQLVMWCQDIYENEVNLNLNLVHKYF